MIKLHLGCGKVYIPGFIHIDLEDYKHIDYNHNISNLEIYEDNTIDLIYCCHALEYFDRNDAEIALKEWYRVLKPGGVLRLAVPDFEAIVSLYLNGSLMDRGILGPLYGRMKVKDIYIYHKTVYDFYSLKELLERIGFNNIHRYDWRKTEHSNIDDYSQSYIPHMEKENGFLISLNIEAKK